MGQSFSRRPAPAPTPAAASAPDLANLMPLPRRSLPRRILSSLPKPSLRSRTFASSLALPPRPEQTLRGKRRPWRLARRRSGVPAYTEGAAPGRMDPLLGHGEHQVDRDVDEFGVIAHRVSDSHTNTDSSAASAKGKEKANVFPNVDDETPVPSSSTSIPTVQTEPGLDHVDDDDDDDVVIAPIARSLRQTPPLRPAHEYEHPFVPLPQTSPLPSTPQSSQQTNSSTVPRPFPPPGTLVVVQGVVHTTDVPRSSDRPVAISNPAPTTINDVLDSSDHAGLDPISTRSSSVPPAIRSRNPLSGILPRPSSMLPTVPSPPPSELISGSSNTDSQHQQTATAATNAAEDNEDEDQIRTLPHEIPVARGSVGASGLSASSIDVLGTLLSVAAAATAASLLTGSSEPIFSSGLTSQPQPSLNPISQPLGPNPYVPSERPLSPTPTSDAGRMRHVWSSLRDRLGLGNGAQTSNHSSDIASALEPGQSTPSLPSDVVRPRDPREVMLAEMARAFNLGLGLGATTGMPASTSSADSNTPELTISNDADVLSRDGDGTHLVFPPPDSFERFLIDLQTDLRVTFMQGQDLGTQGELPRDFGETAEDEEEDEPIPELLSLTDSDSENLERRCLSSDDEAEFSYEEDMPNEGDEEDIPTAQEQPSGRTSPAVSALGSGVHSPFGVRIRPGSPSTFSASATPLHRAAPSLPMTIFSERPNGEIAVNEFHDKDKNEDSNDAHASSSEMGTHVIVGDSGQAGMRSEEVSEGRTEGAVLGVAHSLEASNEGWTEAEGARNILGTTAVPPPDLQDPSNVLAAQTERESFLLGTSSLPGSLTPLSGASTSQVPEASILSVASPESTAQQSSSTSPTLPDSSMPLPFAPSSASRTERTPGGGINWWRMYRFPAVASPNSGQDSQPAALQTPIQGAPAGITDRNPQDEVTTPSARTPSAATSASIPEVVFTANESTNVPFSTSSNQDFRPSTNTTSNLPDHRSNVVVPVIVVGLQSVNMDRQPPHMPHPHINQPPGIDDENDETVNHDGSEQPISVPLQVPEPPDFHHHSTPSNTAQQEQGGQRPPRGRTWQSRAANAIRNLRPSRRNADATSPAPQETSGSRTFLIYVIGGYYPPDHQIITGGNLDSFEALWELAEMLGQVKPPTVSKEEIAKSGLEIIKASMLEEYGEQGRVASNCTEGCLICLDDYNLEDELRVLTCKHTFHRDCVDRWLETGRNNCPACRTRGVGNESTGNTGTPSSDPAIA